MLEMKRGGLKTGPILLICFTNHALDQFLEKISDYTKKIIRLGGGTKNDYLKQFTLSEIRLKKGLENPKEYRTLMWQQH